MRFYVRGPGIGPFRTVLWSSGRHRQREHSPWWLVLWSPLLVFALWQVVKFWPADIVIGVLIVLAVIGWLSERREKRAATTTPAPGTPEPQAKHSDRR